MARYQFDGEAVTLFVSHQDVDLLISLTEQLTELLSEGLPDRAVGERRCAAGSEGGAVRRMQPRR